MSSDAQIEEYLACVAASEVLGKSERRLSLLEYILRQELSGQGEHLKAYSIGIDVLNKPEDFDPSIDSGVRVEMGRLRTALASFEGSDAAQCDLCVEIPTGSYRPIITTRKSPATDSPADKPRPNKKILLMVAAASALVTVGVVAAVFFLVPLFGDRPGSPATGVRLAMTSFVGEPTATAQVEAALSASLIRNPSIAVVSQGGDAPRYAEFALRGLVSNLNRTNKRIHIELLDLQHHRLIWSKSLRVTNEEDLAQIVSDELGNELNLRLLGAAKDFLEDRDPESLSAEQLFVMATWVPSPTAANSLVWEEQKIALMQLALDRDQDLGTAHSVMADKLAQLANFYPRYNTPEVQDVVLEHIRRATELQPFHPDVMFNIAQAHWHAGRVDDSTAAMLRVLDLDPGHDLARFLSIVIPYTCSVPPDAVVEQAVAFDSALSPDNPARWITLNWIAWLKLNTGDGAGSLEAKQLASFIFETPYTFVGHAMILNTLGRTEEAAAVLERQQSSWPDITVAHFATVTVPRLCKESADPEPLISEYEALATAIEALR
ncbi:hypothetical protein BC777_3476 [Yoonia maricola]|uniref:Uncharacterized protein n=1 Tax=Yoonia maricola TaxID=420999 RepID=A0A2M8W0H2_9RHOB|nr:tetratricopeptide repeat protein [Yoonia maricola]PJI84418.1 hypothetical protein BC777_3476 [Yoonia maricola]